MFAIYLVRVAQKLRSLGTSLTQVHFAVELFGHRIPAPILFAPIGINKLYSPEGELIPAKIAGELGLPVCADFVRPVGSSNFYISVLQYCLSTAASNSIEDVAAANDSGASSIASDGGNYCQVRAGSNAKSPRFFQLYMGHDDDVVSLLTLITFLLFVAHSHCYIS